jgi:hypothetical protein
MGKEPFPPPIPLWEVDQGATTKKSFCFHNIRYIIGNFGVWRCIGSLKGTEGAGCFHTSHFKKDTNWCTAQCTCTCSNPMWYAQTHHPLILQLPMHRARLWKFKNPIWRPVFVLVSTTSRRRTFTLDLAECGVCSGLWQWCCSSTPAPPALEPDPAMGTEHEYCCKLADNGRPMRPCAARTRLLKLALTEISNFDIKFTWTCSVRCLPLWLRRMSTFAA